MNLCARRRREFRPWRSRALVEGRGELTRLSKTAESSRVRRRQRFHPCRGRALVGGMRRSHALVDIAGDFARSSAVPPLETSRARRCFDPWRCRATVESSRLVVGGKQLERSSAAPARLFPPPGELSRSSLVLSSSLSAGLKEYPGGTIGDCNRFNRRLASLQVASGRLCLRYAREMILCACRVDVMEFAL